MTVIMTGVVVILSTCGSEEAAAEIARPLVEKGLAACVNIVPRVRSIYRWKGAVSDEAEALMVIKTSAERQAEAVAALRAAHPYEVPEILVFTPGDGSPPYLDWVLGETRA